MVCRKIFPDSLDWEMVASVAMIETAMIGTLMNLKMRMKTVLTKSEAMCVISVPQRPLAMPSTMAAA